MPELGRASKKSLEKYNLRLDPLKPFYARSPLPPPPSSTHEACNSSSCSSSPWVESRTSGSTNEMREADGGRGAERGRGGENEGGESLEGRGRGDDLRGECWVSIYDIYSSSATVLNIVRPFVDLCPRAYVEQRRLPCRRVVVPSCLHGSPAARDIRHSCGYVWKLKGCHCLGRYRSPIAVPGYAQHTVLQQTEWLTQMPQGRRSQFLRLLLLRFEVEGRGIALFL